MVSCLFLDNWGDVVVNIMGRKTVYWLYIHLLMRIYWGMWKDQVCGIFWAMLLQMGRKNIPYKEAFLLCHEIHCSFLSTHVALCKVLFLEYTYPPCAAGMLEYHETMNSMDAV